MDANKSSSELSESARMSERWPCISIDDKRVGSSCSSDFFFGKGALYTSITLSANAKSIYPEGEYRAW